MKMNRPCLRKGVAVGRVVAAVNELYTQITVLDEADISITQGAVNELKKSLGPLKRNLKGAAPEIEAINQATKVIDQALRGKPEQTALTHLKAEVKAIQTNFRKAVKTGFSDCGAPTISGFDMANLMDDHAYYVEMPIAPSP
jgi:soluble cytochrome b562